MSPLLARALFVRGGLIWAGVRAMASAVLALAGADPLHASGEARLTLIATAVLAAVAQTLRLRERMLLGNLGVSALEVVAWFAAAAALGELVVALVGAVIG